MRKSLYLALGVAICTVPAMAHATPILLGIGQITGTSAGEGTDLSGLTGTLENGLPAAFLGGIGSGLAAAGAMFFWACQIAGRMPHRSTTRSTTP